jgi:DNA-directed RNA polymerase subunit RPC12/RpoP
MTCAICGKTGDTAMFILQHKNCTRRKFTHCAICAAPRRSPLYKDTTKNPAWVYHCASCRAKLRPKQMRSGPIHKEVTCPHCGKTGRGHAMRLWHFDKCKVLRQTPSTFANLPL